MKSKASQRSIHKKIKAKSKPKSPVGFLKSSAIGALAAVAILILLGFLLSYILYMTDDPGRYITPIAFCALYIAALAGGNLALRLNRVSPLLCGLSVGAILTVLTFLLSLTVNYTLSSGYTISGALGLRLAIIVCSVIGAYTGTVKKEAKRNSYKHKKR